VFMIILFVYGSCGGSLIGALASRYATRESYWFPASHCDTCQIPLAYWQLVPVLSYLLVRGKCLRCSHPIPCSTFILEVGAGLVATSITDFGSARVVLWLGLWTFAALCDAQTQTFPGWISWGATSLALWHQPPMVWVLTSLFLFMTHRLWRYWQHPTIGDGDVDLMVSYGVLFGPSSLAKWLFVASLLGLLATRSRGRLAFLPHLVASAVGWWLY